MNDNQSAKILWNFLKLELDSNTIEITSNPISKAVIPKWFTVQYEPDQMIITPAEVHHPSSKITSPRKITFSQFEKIYPYYIKRKKGEMVSQEVIQLTQNQTYHYGLMRYAEELLDK